MLQLRAASLAYYQLLLHTAGFVFTLRCYNQYTFTPKQGQLQTRTRYALDCFICAACLALLLLQLLQLRAAASACLGCAVGVYAHKIKRLVLHGSKLFGHIVHVFIQLSACNCLHKPNQHTPQLGQETAASSEAHANANASKSRLNVASSGYHRDLFEYFGQ